LSRLSRDSAGQSQPIIEQTAYRFRLVVPDLPQPESFLPYLQAAHDSGWFTNFGPLVRRLERELERIFGRNGKICVSASSATAGLSAALLALECKGGCGACVHLCSLSRRRAPWDKDLRFDAITIQVFPSGHRSGPSEPAPSPNLSRIVCARCRSGAMSQPPRPTRLSK
jgi:DegT/DnrJ/EryC1/StrS aminotransferase family